MKIQVKNYQFNSSAKTVTFTDYSSISLESILLIVNVSVNQIIYNFANPMTGGTVLGNVLTLDYPTVSMANEDKLLIYYDSDAVPASEESLVLLRRMVRLMESLAVIDINQRQRVNVETGTLATVSTVSTVNTVGNTTALGGADARFLLIDTARNAFANGVRSKLDFS